MSARKSVRAPLASQEGMDDSPLLLSGTKVETIMGKEFKVISHIQLTKVLLD